MTWRVGDCAVLLLVAGCSTEPSIALVATPDSAVFANFGAEAAPLTLQLASPGGDGAWSATSPAPWLAILPPAGSSMPARLTMTAAAAGLSGGTFRTTMRVDGPHGSLAVPVRLEVPRVSGPWTGAMPDGVGLVLTLNDSAGVISGTGAFVGANGSRVALVVAGTHVHPYVIFTLNVQFFAPATISGVFVSPTSLSGALTGSGYTGQAINLIQP